MLSFSLDTSPRSFSPFVNRLVDNGLFNVSPDRYQLSAASARPCRVLASCTRAPAGSPTSCNRLGWGVDCSILFGGHKSGEMKSDVSWRKNSTVERARWAVAPSCNGVTVAAATAQMIRGLYQISQPQSLGNCMKSLDAKNYICTICFGEVMITYRTRPFFLTTVYRYLMLQPSRVVCLHYIFEDR